ncbi:carboxylate-amine ligase [Actinoplanes octamycinicus]|uniref:Putative glutamate--cysteine ligase 2 n=1 Tax=Actinoplanes octamycinicus TaxID=135948 RepID=A0A7W7MB42_9ACTN|nr:glutamate--cysteine ligase [Actinoplanes octamycinicus]MBB4743749.1 carboxylate-amine ligase [Actinoplanes octamycinicus]GIE61179.1 putative glutamate--cysteine ligase 2 [Actinoplanes octamycinicus]
MTAALPDRLTVGVEEEFLLLDPGTGENIPVAEKVLAGLPEPIRRRSRREFRPSMVELVTDVCTEAGELTGQLLANRRAGAETASAAGAALTPAGATPVAERFPEPADDPRFRAITGHYGPIAGDPSVCGCHVHVGVPDEELAVRVCTRLRGDLPVIQALAANSPVFEGADTGCASWRCVQLDRWPSLGAWPHLESASDYRRTVDALIASGAMMDDTMVLWWARPSASFPTVEVRIADVCPRAADTVLVAALIRGLVDTAARAAADGRSAPELPDALVGAAHWNAARTGLDGTLLDPVTGRARPAWDAVAELVDRIGPALRRHGDLDLVTAGLDRVRREGTGAARQRRLLAATGLPGTLARLAAEATD